MCAWEGEREGKNFQVRGAKVLHWCERLPKAKRSVIVSEPRAMMGIWQGIAEAFQSLILLNMFLVIYIFLKDSKFSFNFVKKKFYSRTFLEMDACQLVKNCSSYIDSLPYPLFKKPLQTRNASGVLSSHSHHYTVIKGSSHSQCL